jgi:pyrroloquinoline quinone (PQQ) biosynthesis protein C
MSAHKTSIIAILDQALAEVEREVENQHYWRHLTDPTTPASTVLAIMREVMLEIWTYQKAVNESVFTAVGRLGNDISEQALIRSMIAVQIEEIGHGTLGLHDHVALGGDREAALRNRPSPTAQALIAIVRVLGEREHPLCHLGYMYFFEKFTTMISEKVAPTLARAGYPDQSLEFMRLHAIEDVRHADMLANVIVECEERYPEAAELIQYGFDCFRVVYPHLVWSAAHQRATVQATAPSCRA